VFLLQIGAGADCTADGGRWQRRSRKTTPGHWTC